MMSSVATRNQYQSQPFDQLAEKYLIKQEIGRSQAASLYRAVEKSTGRAIALKIFRHKFSADPRFALNFRNYMRQIFKIENEYLVSILDYGMADGSFYIASEWVNGQDLGSYLAQVGSLGELTAIAIASQVCQALDVIHRSGLLHQNLKPQNILLTSEGRVKLSDVGLSGLMSESGLSRTHVMLGRYHYIAPEQVSGQDLTPGMDLYSLGVILYEMLTGQFPFDGRDVWDVLRMHVESQVPPLDQKLPKISGSLTRIVQRTLQKSPEERYPSAEAMNAALTAVLLDSVPIREDLDSFSAIGIWGQFKYLLNKGKAFLRRPAPVRILGKSYPFGWMLLVQFMASFLIGFLILSTVFMFTGRLLQNRVVQESISPTAGIHLMQKSAPKTKLLKPDQGSLVVPNAYQPASSYSPGLIINLIEMQKIILAGSIAVPSRFLLDSKPFHTLFCVV